MESQNSNVTSSFNNNYLDVNILSLRLDTSALLKDIEIFLKGTKIEKFANNKGETEFREIKLGKPLMNSEGVQAVVNYLRLTISPHTVQGNFTDNDFRCFVAEMDINLSCNLMINLDRWGVDENDYDHIIDSIMSSIQMYSSRLIGNEERKSYASSLVSKESNTIDSGKKSILSLGGN